MKMKLFLGVDSGGTKTKFLLVNEFGTKLAESIQLPSHYLQVGYDGLKQVMELGLNDCISQAKVRKADIVQVFASVAGFGDIESDGPIIKEVVKEVFYPINTCVGNDVENAFAGALKNQAGIVIIAGTGSIGLGLDPQGNTYRCGGWHHLFGGDEGSAYWIACKLILEFTCQSDGRSDKTLLYDYMKHKYKLSSDSDILQMVIVDWESDRTKIAGLAHDVYDLAIKGDLIAIDIFTQAAYELSRIIITIKNKLEFKERVLASYQGGVFKSSRFIIEPLTKYLLPFDIELISPYLTPDQGSALLALNYGSIEITENIINNLKT